MSFACTLCDKPAVLQRVSYTIDGKLFSGVPVMVCSNPDCCVKRGATVVDQRSIARPPSETELQPVKVVVESKSERDQYIADYDRWVEAGKPDGWQWRLPSAH